MMTQSNTFSKSIFKPNRKTKKRLEQQHAVMKGIQDSVVEYWIHLVH